jgi:Serine/threonine protein phosphatase
MKVNVLTHIGIVRKENQDSVVFELFESKNRAIAVVCDGMGGARAGSVASSLAAESFMEEMRPVLNSPKRITGLKEKLIAAAVKSNSVVFESSKSTVDYHGMGTTLVALFHDGSKYFVINIGDSRAYHINGKKAARITRDHSFVEELVDRGELTPEQARVHPRKNIITRALGIASEVQCDVFDGSLKKGEYIMLCSDGLTNLVFQEELSVLFEKYKEPELICKELVDLAIERGAPDNVTVAVLSL